MQIFYEIVVLLSCLCGTLLVVVDVCVAQPSIRHGCALQLNCNRTNVDVCATNGQSCKRFPSDCELQRENCNATTTATAWNRTSSLQCSNLRINGTGVCACSTDALRACSNRTVTTGICAHGGAGAGVGTRVHQCRLFRTECDFRRTRCRGEEWRSIDNRQCRGFTLNQTNPCLCPKLLQCSANRTQRCVRVSQSSCHLYTNECDLERHRCAGERLTDVAILHCRNFQANRTQRCHCPGLMSCQRNNTNICVRNAAGRCQLMTNECDLEQRKCDGNVLTNATLLQCLAFQPGDNKACTCPKLLTCSRNTTNICVQTLHGCILFRNECEVEEEKCKGKNFTIVDRVQCRRFAPTILRKCACPNVGTCDGRSPNICVTTSTNLCRLKRNHCELEKARCEGEVLNITHPLQCRNFNVDDTSSCVCPLLRNCQRNPTSICARAGNNQCRLLRNGCEVELAKCVGKIITNSLHCLGFQPGDRKTCTCPKLMTCSNNTTNTCIKTPQGCLLMKTECELEQEKCKGTNFTVVDGIQCRGFMPNKLGKCLCPNIGTCDGRSPNICVTTSTNQCRLKRNNCDLEKARCEGEVLKITHSLQCRNFSVDATKSCACPRLMNCQRNSTSICARAENNQCRLLRNGCELEQAKCEGKNLQPTHSVQCLNNEMNLQKPCFCPKLLTCSKNSTKVCIKTRRGCKLLTTQCEVEEAKCRGEEIADIVQCQGFRDREEKSCACPKLNQCARITSNICIRTSSTCTLVGNQCEFERRKCQNPSISTVSLVHCKAFRVGDSRTCSCPNLLNCSKTPSAICVRTINGCKLLRNQCELEQERCQGNYPEIVSPLHCLRFELGQQRTCSCPTLQKCRRNNVNICIKTETGCRLLRNECELEEMKCRGQSAAILPALQCRSLSAGHSGSCSCPNLFKCLHNSPRQCVETRGGCKLLRNLCELEQMKCQGEAFKVTTIFHCLRFAIGEVKACSCPSLRQCSANIRYDICVTGPRGCRRMANSCDLEIAKCKGEFWRPEDPVQCRNLPRGHTGNCFCPKLKTCSGARNTRVCVENRGQCRHLRSSCELEMSRCLREGFSLTSAQRCHGIAIGSTSACACPALARCNRRRRVCTQLGSQCRLFRNDCDHKRSTCQGENWRGTSMNNCCHFGVNQIGNCAVSASSAICGRARKSCRLFATRCDLDAVNSRIRRRRRRYAVVARSQCKCVGANGVGGCVLQPMCTVPHGNARRVCARFGRELRWFNSQCQLQHHSFNTCRRYRTRRASGCRNIRN